MYVIGIYIMKKSTNFSIFTLPSGAFAKYCDEYIYVCVCLSVQRIC